MNIRKGQRGLSLVEFTAVATFLLLVIFSFIEFGIYLYSIQTLNDMTRRGARLAAVCYPAEPTNIPEIVTQGAPLGIEPDNIIIEYLDDNSATVAIPQKSAYTDESGDFDQDSYDSAFDSAFAKIRYVRASTDYSFHFIAIFSWFNVDAVMPQVETVLPAESLGVLRPLSDGEQRRTTCE